MHDEIIRIHGRVVEAVVAVYSPHRLDVAKRAAVWAGAGVRAGVVAFAHHEPHDGMALHQVLLHPRLVPRSLRLRAVVIPEIVIELQVCDSRSQIQCSDLAAFALVRAWVTRRAAVTVARPVDSLVRASHKPLRYPGPKGEVGCLDRHGAAEAARCVPLLTRRHGQHAAVQRRRRLAAARTNTLAGAANVVRRRGQSG